MQRKLKKDEKSDERKWTKRVCFSDEHEIEQTKGEERYEGGEMRVEGGKIKKTEENKEKEMESEEEEGKEEEKMEVDENYEEKEDKNVQQEKEGTYYHSHSLKITRKFIDIKCFFVHNL